MSQHVSHEDAAKALDSLDDYARMGTGVDAHGPRGMLERYIAQQAATLRQAPAQGGVTEAMSSIEDAIACGQMNAPKVFTKMRELVIAALSAQQWQGEAVATTCEGATIVPSPPAQPAERVPEELKELANEMEACWICASNGDGEITLETINNWAGRLALLAASPAPSPARGDGGEG